jgi:hypothetical protein
VIYVSIQLRDHIQTRGFWLSAIDWTSEILLNDYVGRPLLQKELEVDLFGVCGDLVPVPSDEKSHEANISF